MTAARLSQHSAPRLAQSVERLRYLRAPADHGIVHVGLGAFHRAHQAVYTDDAISASDELWGITGVSLRSAQVAAQLTPQDGLYTASFRSTQATSRRVIGAVRRVLVAREDPAAVIAAIASPATHLVSFTVSEKGYCRDASGRLDATLADAHSFYRFVKDGMLQRQRAGLPGLTLLSCDNLAGNGAQLERLLGEYLDRHAPQLGAWFRAGCTCPSTMVDRIVPASSLEDLDGAEAALGLRDEAAVFTEPFTQWVIEDRFAGPRPQWEAGGAQFTRQVASYETAKLRMLNGAHSALAYLGLARGHEFVHQAIADLPLRTLVERLMRSEAAPTIVAAADQDLDDYADRLLERFANAALRHRLAQISMDGSQKIPQRWLETLRYHQRQGRTCPALLTALAAWLAFVRADQWKVEDPQSVLLADLWRGHAAEGVIDALFGAQGMFSGHWVAGSADRAALLGHLANPAAL